MPARTMTAGSGIFLILSSISRSETLNVVVLRNPAAILDEVTLHVARQRDRTSKPNVSSRKK
jgi:hypothetical protein